jgi:large subunit ribosomal protein L6
MSRIGIQPIEIPDGVEVKIEKKGRLGGQKITVKGSLGELEEPFRKEITVKQDGDKIVLARSDDSKKTKSLHGLYRTLIANMFEGVTKGYEKKLEIVGIGYRAELKGQKLEITVGSTHPYIVEAPEGITFEVDDKVNITIKGADKQMVGQLAAQIRSFSKPEPYKGKGIRYVGEYVRRKAGKVAKAAEGGAE